MFVTLQHDISNKLNTQFFIEKQECEIQSNVVLIYCEVNRNMMIRPLLIMTQQSLY